MKTTTLKTKVIARLVKWGHNPERAEEMTNEHFDYAVQYYTGVSKIADVIATL